MESVLLVARKTESLVGTYYFRFLVGLYFVVTDLTALVFLSLTVVVNKEPYLLDFCSVSDFVIDFFF